MSIARPLAEPAAVPRAAVLAAPAPRVLAGWLLACAALVYGMVVLGGVTRLTGSGLSIVEWRPVTGALPPLHARDWQEAFAAYRASPEFRLANPDMTLAGFQRIFWVEWAHRLLGRLLGVVFFVPFAWWGVRRRLPRRLAAPLAGILLLGGAQGALGWFMVRSGLVDVPQVSAYRLTAHLLVAVALLAALLWTALEIVAPRAAADARRGAGAPRWLPRAATAVVVLTLAWGGFMAGTHAGYAYRTFPLIGGQLVPDGLWANEPPWRAPFESMLAVQFFHRTLALLALGLVLAWWWRSRQAAAPGSPPRAIRALPLLAVAQVSLGIATLLLGVPHVLASLHQATGVALFATCVAALHARGRTSVP